MKNRLLAAAIVAGTIAIAASLLAGAQIVALPALATALLRWLAILLIAANATSRRSLTGWILVGLLAGAELGHYAPSFAVKLQFLGTIFLRLIKVIIAPLLFGTLVVGIAGHADLKKVGRLGIKSLVYFEIVSTIALLIGFAAINLSRAGEGVRLPPSTAAEPLNAAPHTATQLITDIFPENIAKSVADGQVLQVVVFSILFAMALALVPEPKRRPMLAFAESLSETMFKFTNIVMLAAPIGAKDADRRGQHDDIGELEHGFGEAFGEGQHGAALGFGDERESHGEQDAEDDDLQHLAFGNGLGDIFGEDVGDELRRGVRNSVQRFSGGRGRKAHAFSGAADVDGGEADEQGDSGDDLEVDEGLDSETANFFQVGVAGNAHDKRA